jgi:hypothetical protein
LFHKFLISFVNILQKYLTQQLSQYITLSQEFPSPGGLDGKFYGLCPPVLDGFDQFPAAPADFSGGYLMAD